METTDIRIRPIVAVDIESMVDCISAVFLERIYLAYVEPPERSVSVAHFASALAAGYPRMVAVDGDRVVGWCDINPAAPALAASQTHIGRLGMGLLPAYRGQGLGEKLLRTTLDAGRAQFERIELNVYSHNKRAHQLYLRCGFIEEGRRRAAWKLDGRTSDIIEMGLLYAETSSESP